MEVLEIGEVQCEENIGFALPSGDKVNVIIHGTSTDSMSTGLAQRISNFFCIEHDHGGLGNDLFPYQTSGEIRIHSKAEGAARAYASKGVSDISDELGAVGGIKRGALAFGAHGAFGGVRFERS